jgi:hypothetical protein
MKQDTSKNREIGWEIGLSWLPFGQKSNNQQIVGGNDARNDGEGAWLGRSVWGDGVSLCGVANRVMQKIQNKICHGLRWRWYDISHATTNQKHVGAMERVNESRCNQGGARRGDDTIILGGIRS